MDTESFLLRRHTLVERMEERRVKDLSSYAFPMGSVVGLTLPVWARWALSLAPRGGVIGSLVQVGLPLAATLFLKKKSPLLTRLIGHFLPSRL